MPTGLFPTDVVNRAIQLIGDDQPPVTGNYPDFDNSAAGVAAAALYDGVVQTVGRQFGWDFSNNSFRLVPSGQNPPPGFANEYLYPSNGIEIRQVQPASPDPNNPIPSNWTVGNTSIGGIQTKVIWTNIDSANVFFSNQPDPTLWDAGFTESVVRLLASELAMAIPARPQTSASLLETAGDFQRAAEMRKG